MNISLSPFAQIFWSRDAGSAVPSRVGLLILHTQTESGAYSQDFSRFPRRRPFIYLNRHPASCQSRVYQVTLLRTDGVHCRESVGTGPEVLKVVPVTGAAFSSFTMDQLMCASLYHLPINVRYRNCRRRCIKCNVRVQYNGGLLPDIILLTLRCYLQLLRDLIKSHKVFLPLQPMLPPKRFDKFSPWLWVDAQKAASTTRPTPHHGLATNAAK